MAISLEKLIADAEEIRLMEVKAQKIYKQLLPDIPEEEDKKMLQGIIDDEIRHEKIAQQIIDILKSA